MIQSVINEYFEDTISFKDLCKKYNLHYKDSIEWLNSNGYYLYGGKKGSAVKNYKQAFDEYISNPLVGVTRISNKFNIERHNFSRYLKKLGINVVNYQNKYSVNATYFNNIDTEEKAYWLGFIYADGYVSYTGYNFELSLQLSDKEHLEKLGKVLNIQIKTDHYRARLSCSVKEFRTSLINKGVVPRKSLILKFPDESIVPKNLMIPFIRGYFDGDGCVYYTTRKKQLGWSLLGTQHMLEGVKRYANVPQKVHFHKTIGSLSSSGICYFLHTIYKDSTIHLERKYLKYKQYCRLSK